MEQNTRHAARKTAIDRQVEKKTYTHTYTFSHTYIFWKKRCSWNRYCLANYVNDSHINVCFELKKGEMKGGTEH